MNPQQNIIGHEEDMEVAKRQVDYARILRELAVAKAYLIALEADPKTVLKKFLEGKGVDYVRMINHTYQLKKATHAEALKAVDEQVKEFTATKNKKEGVAPPAAEAKVTREMECQTDPQDDESEDAVGDVGFTPQEYLEARSNIQYLRTQQYKQLLALKEKYNALVAELVERDWLNDINSELPEGTEEHKEVETILIKPPEVKEMDTWEAVAADVKKSSGIWRQRQKQVAAAAKAKEEAK